MTAKHHVGGVQAPLQSHSLNLEIGASSSTFLLNRYLGSLDSDSPEALPRPDFELELIFGHKQAKSVRGQRPSWEDIFSLCPFNILYTRGCEL